MTSSPKLLLKNVYTGIVDFGCRSIDLHARIWPFHISLL